MVLIFLASQVPKTPEKVPIFILAFELEGTLITEDRFAWIAAFKSAENYHAENLTNPYSELTSSRNS